MRWIRRLFGREPERERTAASHRLDRLEAQSDAALRRIERSAAETQQLAAAVRGAVRAIRHDPTH